MLGPSDSAALRAPILGPEARRGTLRVLIATGSTGGHVTPALAIAEALHNGPQDVHLTFVGPGGGVAERMVNAIGGVYRTLEVEPIRGAGPVRAAQGLAALPAGTLRSRNTLRAVQPHVVVGTGAHTSGPLLALAALGGTPTLAFEANVDLGLATKWLAASVSAVAVAWPQTLEALPKTGVHTGWPVRSTFLDPTTVGQEAPDDLFRLLILGGSAGAPELDRAVRAALDHLEPIKSRLEVVHQACSAESEGLRSAYRAAGVDARIETFIDDIAAEYQSASLVLSRAGGATLSELAAIGRASILVPLPAAGHHQSANARAWVEAGCGRVIFPDDISGERLAGEVLALASTPDDLERMKDAAGRLHRADAAQRIADWCRAAVVAK